MDEEDWDGWKALTERIGDLCQLVGDDLFVTNPERLRRGHRAGRRQLDPDQGEPDRHADGDARGDPDRPRRRLHDGDLPPLGRDRGHDDRRPRGGHAARARSRRAHPRARIEWRSTTACSGSRRSSATAPSSPARPFSSARPKALSAASEWRTKHVRMPRAYRHARRRASARAGPSRIRWDRVGRIALVLVLFGVMVSYLNPLVNLLRGVAGIEVERGAARPAQAGEGRADRAAARGLQPGDARARGAAPGHGQARRARLRRARARQLTQRLRGCA